MTEGHLLLIDASGFAHRAYHAGNPTFRSDGLPTWAVLGFLGLMWRLLGAAQADQPTHAAAVFDAPRPTFRHKLFPAYKTNRPARALELAAQLPWMRTAAQAMGIKPLDLAGFEADDLIATLASDAAARGIRCSIVSSDKDFCQLVRDGAVEIVDPIQRVRLREDDIRGRKFGVEPSQVPDYQALAGDAVDNIPGIEGVGAKSAAALIRQFDTVERVVEAAQARSHLIPAGQRVRLRSALEELVLYRRLATLDRNVPLSVGWDDLVLQPILRASIDDILRRLEATARFEQIFAVEPKMQRTVAKLDAEAALEWWHEECLVPGQPVPDEPQAGFYLGTLVRKGPLVPARIWREGEVDFVTETPTGNQILRCTVAGNPRDPVIEWQKLARRPIPQAEYEFQIADGAWAREFAPSDPKANPGQPIDLLKAPPPHCPPTPRNRA